MIVINLNIYDLHSNRQVEVAEEISKMKEQFDHLVEILGPNSKSGKYRQLSTTGDDDEPQFRYIYTTYYIC